jgi:lipopolysaccharide heptosyltransferase II
MKLHKDKVKRILVITLTNIGDVVLTTPVFAALKQEFPGSRLDVMVSPQGAEIFRNDPGIFKVIVYDKFASFTEKFRLFKKLRQIRYDLAVDLRNTLFPYLIGAKYKTNLFRSRKPGMHRREYHLLRLKKFSVDTAGAGLYFHIPEYEKANVDRLIGRQRREDFICVAPGAKSLIKRWTSGGYARLCDLIMDETDYNVLLTGDSRDKQFIQEIIKEMRRKPVDISGLTNLKQLAEVIRRSKMLITNDSAPMHIGCAVGTKVLGIFGPTDPVKYGPCGPGDAVVSKDLPCVPCRKAECGMHNICMKDLKAEEVFESVKRLLGDKVRSG